MPTTAAAADSRIEILTGETIGTIAPEIYGHFVEHLGGVVYDGIWVGEKSKIPNIWRPPQIADRCFKENEAGPDPLAGRMFRRQLRLARWHRPQSEASAPYEFLARRPEWPKGAPDGPWKYDTNQFGTNDFLRFCKLAGGEPYIAANLRSLTAKIFTNGLSTATRRRARPHRPTCAPTDGEREPFNVRYWGVGNESWGCGGNFTPEEYAAEYRRFTAWVPSYRTSAGVHRLRAERRRPRLDAPLLY